MAANGMQGRTTWSRGITAPVRAFLRTESGSAGVLVAAIVVALIWANVGGRSYESFWHTDFDPPRRRRSSSRACATGSTAA